MKYLFTALITLSLSTPLYARTLAMICLGQDQNDQLYTLELHIPVDRQDPNYILKLRYNDEYQSYSQVLLNKDYVAISAEKGLSFIYDDGKGSLYFSITRGHQELNQLAFNLGLPAFNQLNGSKDIECSTFR